MIFPGAFAVTKLRIPVVHVEADLGSVDLTMPEGINSIVTDSISDLLLVSELPRNRNFLREDHPQEHLHLVNNVRIDILLSQESITKDRPILKEHGLTPTSYALVTLHRPSNGNSPNHVARTTLSSRESPSK